MLLLLCSTSVAHSMLRLVNAFLGDAVPALCSRIEVYIYPGTMSMKTMGVQLTTQEGSAIEKVGNVSLNVTRLGCVTCCHKRSGALV